MNRLAVSKNFRLAFTAFALGLILFLPALVALLRFRFPSDLNSSTIPILRSGEYLHCTIEKKFTLPILLDEKDTGMVTAIVDGISAEHHGGRAYYQVCFALIDDRTYVRIGLTDPKLLEALESKEDGAITLLGKVLKKKDSYNYQETIRSWKKSPYEQLLKDVYVLQVNEKAEFRFIMLRLLFGTLLLIFALFMQFSGRGIFRILVRPLEETPEYVEVEKGVNYVLEEELELRKQKLEALNRKKSLVNLYALAGILPCILGGGILYDHYCLRLVEHHFFLLGACLILLGFELIWHSFINSDTPLALGLADRFTLDTLATKIKKEEIFIGILSRRIDHKKSRQKKRALD